MVNAQTFSSLKDFSALLEDLDIQRKKCYMFSSADYQLKNSDFTESLIL